MFIIPKRLPTNRNKPVPTCMSGRALTSFKQNVPGYSVDGSAVC